MNKCDSIYKSPFVHRENYIMIIHKKNKNKLIFVLLFG